MPEPRSVAVTGACGGIGGALVERLAARGHPLTLVDRPGAGVGSLSSAGTTVELDLARPAPPGLFDGVDTVVHLAGDPRPDATWEVLLADNIQASYNVASAAIAARCRRLIVASSVHAVSASAERPVAETDPVAPADLYGVTKCFVEALASWCAHRGAMSAAAVRIGAFQTLEAARAPWAGDQIGDTFIAVPDLLALRRKRRPRLVVLPAVQLRRHLQLRVHRVGAVAGDHHLEERDRPVVLRAPRRQRPLPI